MPVMALTVGDRDVRPLTADEVMAMVEAGILAEDEPVELLHGALVAVSPTSPAHEAIKARLLRWLARGDGAERYELRIEGALVVPDRTSLPEPDLMVLPAVQDPARHPTTALLVVEVAVSSLATDTTIKPALYAAAGVPELWVVDVGAERLEAFGEPQAGEYRERTTHVAPAALVPRRVGVAPLDLAGLFAGL